MKRTFNFAKGKEYEVKEIIQNANLPLSWTWDVCQCPKCNEKIQTTKSYTIDKIEVLEDKDGNIISLGYTKEMVGNRPLTLRLPDKDFHVDKDMTDSITAKSKYLKEK
jgi:hypothetical protein